MKLVFIESASTSVMSIDGTSCDSFAVHRLTIVCIGAEFLRRASTWCTLYWGEFERLYSDLLSGEGYRFSESLLAELILDGARRFGSPTESLSMSMPSCLEASLISSLLGGVLNSFLSILAEENCLSTESLIRLFASSIFSSLSPWDLG